MGGKKTSVEGDLVGVKRGRKAWVNVSKRQKDEIGKTRPGLSEKNDKETPRGLATESADLMIGQDRSRYKDGRLSGKRG